MEALALGLALGLGAGVSPGPLLGLVLTSALRGGARPGLLAACAPLVTDLPIVVLSVTVLSALPTRVLAVAALAGGLFVVWLGVAAFRDARLATGLDEPPGGGRRVLWQAAAVNLTSPHPWLFWLTVGAPVLVTAWRHGPASAVGFVVGFYGLLVGSKAVVAVTVGLTRHRLSPTWLRRLLAAAATLLVLAGAALVVEFAAAAVTGTSAG